MKTKNWIIEGCAFSLILLFVYTATSKFFQFTLFRYQLNLHPWIRHVAGLVAWGIPAFELGIAALLISLKGRLIGFYASLALLLIFTLYLLGMLQMDELHRPCSCGGVIQQLSWKQHVFFNLLFIGIAALGIRYERKFARSTINSTLFNHF